MFRNIYTTHMSGNGKMLKMRFERIVEKPMKMGRIAAILCAFSIVAAFALSTVIMAAFDKNDVDFKLDITNNGEIIKLENKLFVANGEVYVPLREFFAKMGFMDLPEADMLWDNGVVLVRLAEENNLTGHGGQIFHYFKVVTGVNKLFINASELTGFAESDEVVKETKNAPILKHGVTYLPFEMVNEMIEWTDKTERFELGVNQSGNSFVIGYPLAEGSVITQGFGKRVHPITGEEKFHNGIDIKAPEGTPVIAGVDGKITAQGFDKEKGNYITISNENGIEITYSHLAEGLSTKTDIKRGDIIAYSGNTGMSTGPHLHMEVKINGEYVAPELYLEKNAEAELLKAIDEQLPRALDRAKLQGYEYLITGIDMRADSWATVSIALTNNDGEQKFLLAEYTFMDNAWGWTEIGMRELHGDGTTTLLWII